MSLSFRGKDPVWQKTAQVDATRIGSGNTVTASTGVSYVGKGSGRGGWREKIDASLGLHLDPLYTDTGNTQARVSSGLQYTGRVAQARGYLEQGVTDSATGQIGGEVQSTVVWSPESGLHATSAAGGPEMALVMIAVRGNYDQKMDIIMNGVAKASVRVGDVFSLPVPVYEKVNIDVADRRGIGMFTPREGSQTVVGYPGNFIYREFNILRSFIIMGSLFDEAGAPLQNARFTVGKPDGVGYYTDEAGFFTVELPVAAGDALDFLVDGYECSAQMPDIGPENGYADLGSVTCTKKPDPQGARLLEGQSLSDQGSITTVTVEE